MRIEPSMKGRRRVSLVAVGLIVAALAGALLAPTRRSFAQEKPAKSLYERMGGYNVIAGLVDNFIAQLGKDPAFKRFGGGRAQDSLVRTRQLVVDQICNLTGGPCAYIGRDMKTAHGGLAVTQEEWDSSMKKWGVALDDFKMQDPERQEFIDMIAKLRPDIVEPPKEEKAKGQK